MPPEIKPAKLALFSGLHEFGPYQKGAARYKIHERFPDLVPAPDKFQVRRPYVSEKNFPLICDTIVWAIEEQIIRDEIDPSSIEAIVGVPQVGNHFADRLSRRLNELTGCIVPVFRFEKEELEGGRRRVSERMYGDFPAEGQCALIVDDLFSTGESVFETAEAMRRNNLDPIWVAGALDRRLTGVERLKQAGFTVITAATVEEFYDFSVDRKLISEQDRDAGLKFIGEAQKRLLAAA